MQDFDYIKDRLEDQINWYDRKSSTNQTYYKRLELLRIGLAVSIPVLTLFLDENSWIKYAIAIVGAIIAFIEGTNQIYNFKDLWTKYRNTSEALKREKLLYQTDTAPYGKDNSTTTLIDRCERIMSSENNTWIELFVENNKV